MSSYPIVSTCALPPALAWRDLVERSMLTWEALSTRAHLHPLRSMIEGLQKCDSLDEFLGEIWHHCMFWFFQKRERFLSQHTMAKWDRDHLDDYILLPGLKYYVNRMDCFFVSHFWHSKEHPDPDGEHLRELQDGLRGLTWSYVWVDWTCMPQDPRNEAEEAYFARALTSMSSLIRNCAFTFHYPPFEPRLWILYEISEFLLTASDTRAMEPESLNPTPDIARFVQHIRAMVHKGVQTVLEHYGYKCSYERDKAFLTSWLELLVLLRQINISIDSTRGILDRLTWFTTAESIVEYTVDGKLELCRFKGTFRHNDKLYTFTPFPRWDGGKFSASFPFTEK